MADLLTDMAAGAAAGVLGGMALGGTAQVLYDLASPKDVALEQAIEPRNPFIVLAQRLEGAAGIEKDERREKLFETAVITVVSASSGALYAAAARKWSLGWLAGGAVFGALFWAIEDEGLGTAMNLAGDNSKYPLEAHLRGLAAHVAFGVVTAGLLKAAGFTESDDEREQENR